uniref:Coiled-coil domain-containing protein 13 n=1 Tax=Anas zonorhyncha TaxID=75864 RepID=A0A8B9ZPU1_9AVES
MERKKDKQSSQKVNNGDAKETFGIPNDLNLFETEQPVTEDDSKRLLEVENEQLQDQLREVRDENCRLYKLVKDKEFEIKQLQKKMQEDRLALSGTSGLAGDVAAAKIVELAKKNREITAETESEKAKVKQLNNKVKELEREQPVLSAIEMNHSEAMPWSVFSLNHRIIKSGKAIQDHLVQHPPTTNVTTKPCFLLILILSSQLLANEVGEDVNIQSLLTNSGSWRGRAQQILVLQSKVRELENQLGQTKSRTSLSEMDEELLALADPRKLSAQEKNLLKIRSLEKEKKEALEKLTGEHDALQKNHEEVKKKLDASKARNKVLCSEVKTLKGQIATLLEKGKHDDELIDALLSQLKQMQEILKHLSQQDEKNKESQQVLGQHLNNEAQKQNCLIEQLRQLVAEREAKVKELEEEIGQLTLQVSFLPCSTVSKMGHMLVESAATQPPLLSNNIPPGSLDFKVLQTQITEHKALCQAAEVERDRLLELVTVLQKRVEESSDKVLEVEKRLQEERRRCVLLEQQLEKLQMDPGRNTSTQKPPLRGKTGEVELLPTAILTLNMSDRKELSAAQLSRLPLESQVEELSTRLVIQLDENEALKAALETTVRKKEEDFKLYQDTMDQVKDIFLQAIRQQKQEKS